MSKTSVIEIDYRALFVYEGLEITGQVIFYRNGIKVMPKLVGSVCNKGWENVQAVADMKSLTKIHNLVLSVNAGTPKYKGVLVTGQPVDEIAKQLGL